MENTLYDSFVEKVQQYKQEFRPVEDEEKAYYISLMEDWVEDNRDFLVCDSITEIFDEYELMLSSRDEFNYDSDEDNESDDYPIINDDTEWKSIRKLRKYCCQ